MQNRRVGTHHQKVTIGELAKRAGVGVETVRFYERRGLIRQPSRQRSGYRHYDADCVRRLLFIRRAKSLGFSLNDIAELLELQFAGQPSCPEVKRRAEEKVAEVEEKIAGLQRVAQELRRLVEACQQERARGECPVLHALALKTTAIESMRGGI